MKFTYKSPYQGRNTARGDTYMLTFEFDDFFNYEPAKKANSKKIRKKLKKSFKADTETGKDKFFKDDSEKKLKDIENEDENSL